MQRINDSMRAAGLSTQSGEKRKLKELYRVMPSNQHTGWYCTRCAEEVFPGDMAADHQEGKKKLDPEKGVACIKCGKLATKKVFPSIEDKSKKKDSKPKKTIAKKPAKKK